MSFLGERTAVIFKAMRYRECWSLPPRVRRALLKSLSGIRPATAGTGTILYVNNPPVESLAFRRYLSGLKRIARGEHVPLVVHMSVTDRCGYKCDRCSNRFMRKSDGVDPAWSDLVELVHALKDAGTVSIAFTGGEPALRDDLQGLVEACRPEIAPLLFTSGQRVSAESARVLRRSGLAMAVVSLDSSVESEHDAIRGEEGAFKQAVRAIGCFLGAGVYTAAQAVVDRRRLASRESLDGFVRFCGGLGVHEVILLDPMAIGSTCTAELPGEEDREYLRRLHLLSAADRNMPKVTTSAYIESSDYFGCLAGYSFFYVNSAGDLCPCDFVPMRFGNVFEYGFERVFAKARLEIKGPCTKCLAALMAKAGIQGDLPPGCRQAIGEISRMDRGEPSRIMKMMME